MPGIDHPSLARRHVHYVAVGGKRRVPFAGDKKDDDIYVRALDDEAPRVILAEGFAMMSHHRDSAT